jgi:predicted metal-dependent peptidase
MNHYGINVNEKVKEARMSLIKTEPFYASIIMNLKLVETASVPTFGVTSKSMYYNPKFAMGLSLKTIKVVLHHEVLHLVFQHHLRGSKIDRYDHDLFNVAGDLAINSHIWMEDGFPDDALVPGRGEYKDFPMGLSAEEYYKRLLKDQDEKEQEKQNENSDDSDDSDSDDQEESESSNESDENSDDENDSDDKSDEKDDSETDDSEEDGESDDSAENDDSEDADSEEDTKADSDEDGDTSEEDDSEGGSSPSNEEATEDELSEDEAESVSTFGDFEQCTEEELEEETQAVRAMTIQAIAAAQMAGADVPNCITQNIDKLMGKPKVPWQKVLRNALSINKKCGINWMKPSRRVRGDFIMPSRKVRTPGGLLFVADTSCSMTEQDLHDGLVECQSALDLTGELDVWQFDTRIQYQETITKETKIETIPMVGRGGTRFQSVIDELKETKKRPQVIVVLTDLYLEKTDWSKELQGIPTIWLCTSNVVAQSGRTINIRD